MRKRRTAVRNSPVRQGVPDRPRSGCGMRDGRVVLPGETTALDRADERDTSAAPARLRSERRELPAHATKRCRGGAVGREVEHPLARGTNELAGDRDDLTPERLRPPADGPAQRLALVEDEQIEGQGLQLEVGRVGPKLARGDAIDPEVLFEFVDGLLHVGALVVER